MEEEEEILYYRVFLKNVLEPTSKRRATWLPPRLLKPPRSICSATCLSRKLMTSVLFGSPVPVLGLPYRMRARLQTALFSKVDLASTLTSRGRVE